ncbi:MAG: hypothetical protein GHCLOJNM_00492 [bacterium]|nr:hypothetical protein [bacterium]
MTIDLQVKRQDLGKRVLLGIALGIPFLATSGAGWDGGDGGFFEPRHLSSIPGETRDRLKQWGLTEEVNIVGEGLWNAKGGRNTHHSGEYRGNIGLSLELDTGQAGLWEEGTLFLHLDLTRGSPFTEEHVGAYMCSSNIECEDVTQISEFWYRQYLFDHKVWVKLGKIDANAEFARIDYAGEFIHSCGAFSPNIPLPTYPDPDWGIILGTDPEQPFSIAAGVFQGRPDGGRSLGDSFERWEGPLVLVEPSFRYDLRGHSGRLALGGWWNGDEFDRLDQDLEDPGTVNGAHGFYVTLEQEIWRENPGCAEGEEQGIGWFLHWAWAPEDRSEVKRFIGTGLQWTGMVPGRDSDISGAALFRATFSDELVAVHGAESAIEVFHEARLTENLSLRPVVQYIVDPIDANGKDALVLGLRFEMSF